MPRQIFLYEVELRVTPHGEAAQILRRLEHAYSVADAVTQAGYNAMAAFESGDLRLLHVGPPAEEIRKEALAARLSSKAKEPKG